LLVLSTKKMFLLEMGVDFHEQNLTNKSTSLIEGSNPSTCTNFINF